MRKRWIPLALIAATVAVIAVTFKLTYASLSAWYAEQYVIVPYLAREKAGGRSQTERQQDFDRIVRQLKFMGLPAVRAILRQLPNDQVGRTCHILLFNVAPSVRGSLPILLAEVTNGSDAVRAAVANAFHWYGSESVQAVPQLMILAEDESPGVRYYASASLGEIAPIKLLELDPSGKLSKLVAKDRQWASFVGVTDPETLAELWKMDMSKDILEYFFGVQFGREVKLPDWWNRDDPLPTERTNCVSCHLTAGRELTVPVRDFARSAHDRAKLSCNDCHGGNTEDDTKAHEHEFDFIGTKLSSHIAACADCHTDEAEAFRKGPHFWDLSKRINRDYPVCIDCHGNHDVGKPPAEFSLMNVCVDCHKKFSDDFPGAATVVAENDRLWKVLRDVQAKNNVSGNPIPAEFRRDLAAVRYASARLVHPAAQIMTEQAEPLNRRVERLRKGLEWWLKENE